MNWGLFLLPSLCTIANLGLGMYSIMCSIQGHFTPAAWYILLGMVLDGMDGMLARLTKGTSKFGVEMDSFADFTTFCIAPALLMYFIILDQYGAPGMLVAFVYIIFGMLRLARFNLKALSDYSPTTVKSPFFEGLPTPGAAGILASFVLTFEIFQKFEQGVTKKVIPLLLKEMPLMFKSIPVLMIILSFLMISKIGFSSFARFKLGNPMPLRTFLLVVVTILLIISYPENMIFILFMLYIAYSLLEHMWKAYVMSRRNVKQERTNG